MALDLLSINAKANEVQIETKLIDWLNNLTWTFEPFDIVLASDIFYDPNLVIPLITLLIASIKDDCGCAIIADMGRVTLDTFMSKIEEEKKFNIRVLKSNFKLNNEINPVNFVIIAKRELDVNLIKYIENMCTKLQDFEKFTFKIEKF